MRKLAVLFLFLLFSFISLPVYAADQAVMIETLHRNMIELQKTVTGLQTTVHAQNEVIREQGLKIDALSHGFEHAPGKPASKKHASHGLSKLLDRTPQIGVIGTIDAKLTEDSTDDDGNDTVALRELAVGFAQQIDDVSRLDAILVFNDNLEDQNVDIEEAYYTHQNLPLGFRGQIGKFRAKIGKQNLQHLHELYTSDYALVIRDFFGEEGLTSSGARLVHDLPTPWDTPMEFTGEILRGNNGNSFSGVSRRPIFNAHLKTVFKTSEHSDIEIGGTTLFGDENPAVFVDGFDDNGNPVTTSVIREKGSGRYGVQVFGTDATLNWRLSGDREVKLQNELYFQNRGTTRSANGNPWGFYSLLNYRFHPRFSGGTRFDYLQPLNVAGDYHSTYGVSPYIVFHQSEFVKFKLQYSHTEPANAAAKSNNEIFLTANIAIGSHDHPGHA